MPRVRILFFLLLLSWSGVSQTADKVPLKSVLEQIAAAHSVRFSYIDEELIVYTLAVPDPKKSLKAKLDHIRKQTRLRIEAVSGNYYTIYNDRKMDKPLCGFLVDAETGRGIENAQVTIENTAHSATSNQTGYFELPVLSPNVILVRHLGYKSVRIEAQNLYVNECPAFRMEAVVEKLNEVTARRYLATGISRNNYGELVVRPGKFGILPGLTEPDVLQAMQQVPGILSTDETVSNISVRGGTHDQNLFLWNGIRVFQTGHFFGLISAFNPLLATNIAISKNGSSAFFGESVSSLVDISSHTRVTDSCYNVVTVDMISANFFSKVRLSERATVQASGRRTFTDVFTSPTFREYEQRIFDNQEARANEQQTILDPEEGFEFYDISAQYHQKVGQKHDFIADFIGLENSVGMLRQTDPGQIRSRLRQRNFGGSLTWKAQWDEQNNSEVQAYGSWYELVSKLSPTLSVADRSNEVSDAGLRLRHEMSLSGALKFAAGYQFDRVSITDKQQTDSERAASESHIFVAESRYRSATGNTEVRGGLRGNYFGRYALFLIEPRLSFTQLLSDKLKLEILAERKSQTMTQLIDAGQDASPIEQRRWALADQEQVPVQRSLQGSVGLVYNHDGWLVSLENFYKKITGISSDSQGFTNQFEFLSAAGEYRVWGSELLCQKSFGRVLGWVSYGFNDNQYDFGQFSPSRFPNNYSISHAVSGAAIYEWDKLRLALGMKWRTGQPVTAPDSFVINPENPDEAEIIYASPNSERLKEYLQFNFSASKSWDVSQMVRITGNASVLNIFDRDNEIGRRYRVEDGALKAGHVYALGRTLNLGVRVDF